MTIAENLDRLVAAKENIAEAIVNKGVEVTETDGLESFAEKIENISTGGAPEWLGDNVWLISNSLNGISGGCHIVYNNELYSIGGTNTDYQKTWRKNVNGTWVTLGSLPYAFYNGCAVVYNNEIHILGGYSAAAATNHYKWNGSSWVKVSTLLYSFVHGGAIVYNNEIHILGSNDTSTSRNHYKWNGSSWVKVSTLPYQANTRGNVVVYKNEIHLLGASHDAIYTNHYKWNGSSWVKVSTLPETAGTTSYQFYTNKDYIIFRTHKWDGSLWSTLNETGGNMCWDGYLISFNTPLQFHEDNLY